MPKTLLAKYYQGIQKNYNKRKLVKGIKIFQKKKKKATI